VTCHSASMMTEVPTLCLQATSSSGRSRAAASRTDECNCLSLGGPE